MKSAWVLYIGALVLGVALGTLLHLNTKISRVLVEVRQLEEEIRTYHKDLSSSPAATLPRGPSPAEGGS